MPTPRGSYAPRPPQLPGYAKQNINPDRGKQSTEQTVDGITDALESLKQFIGVKYTLSNPSSNYASPLDLFYTRAGSLPTYLFSINGAFGVGPNGGITLDGFTWTNNSPGAGAVAWSAGVVTYQGVQYAVASGSAASGNNHIVWQKSSPNVFTSSASGSPASIPALGADDFVIAYNQLGVYEPAFDFTASATGGATLVNRVVLAGSGIEIYNSNNFLVGTIASGGAGGALTLKDQNGANGFQIVPAAAAATATTGASGAPPAQVAGYLICTIAGVGNMKIPFYNN